MSPKNILAIETSSNICGISITSGSNLLAMNEDTSFRKHVELLPGIFKKTLTESNFTLKDIDAIAVNIGPGSFTGLRIGLGFAKGLAYSHNLPIVPVPSLLSLAYGLKEMLPKNGILLSHANRVFYQDFFWENNIPDLRSKPKIFEIEKILLEKDISFQSNCEKIIQSKKVIQKSEPSSLNIGLLANLKYDKWVNDSPYQIVPDYIANFKIKKAST
ncbi:tRNA (adenosine(37)-N6)-threonylcarbamoyltransferase complex dimerization subunit type 1 TsaB [Candidatus Marinimicrobia bacterium]|jgi:tRNA threonylcarbamoyladenosine biosynthesis protein TsaB|nr:tRNA (adenosine(37)-N6)-threonylcarbamoyltransferase complex dimerization subunit type 1 TsaB [Candidatus Neomarinimicrobiota bacterium]|tara:strand:- start:5804 stop:6451 length:648 start_codon:yes stop_codon:yes gene_type:complete